jgi:MOSC domain-containing protein YiiM
MPGFVEAIYLAPEAGAAMRRVEGIAALEGCGIEGDRYCNETGHWSRFGRVCEVTFIEAEDLDAVEKGTGLRVKDGEHRRNVVIRGFSFKGLRRGARFRVGEAVFCGTTHLGAPRTIVASRGETGASVGKLLLRPSPRRVDSPE